jgi:hypothetical protein
MIHIHRDVCHCHLQYDNQNVMGTHLCGNNADVAGQYEPSHDGALRGLTPPYVHFSLSLSMPH